LATAIPEATGSPTLVYTGFGFGPPTEASVGLSWRHRSFCKSRLIATTRPPVGGTALALWTSTEANWTVSMPLVKIERPSVAHPVCRPPITLGRASILASGLGVNG